MDHLHRYLSEKDISALNDSLAKRISQDYSSILTPSEELLVIVTLKGAAFFAADGASLDSTFGGAVDRKSVV